MVTWQVHGAIRIPSCDCLRISRPAADSHHRRGQRTWGSSRRSIALRGLSSPKQELLVLERLIGRNGQYKLVPRRNRDCCCTDHPVVPESDTSILMKVNSVDSSSPQHKLHPQYRN